MATLAIDRTHRYRAAAEIFRRLGVSSDAWVLDVGGGSGNLAQHLPTEKVFTLDPYGGGEFHIRASMDRIPLPDESFDMVVQIDSLEHVPADIRSRSLEETARVARDYLVWIGPVDSELTVEVEEDLCESHRRLFLGREMDWLSEHRVHGLPREEEVLRSLRPHFGDTASWRSFPLRRWWTLMRLDQQLEAGMFQPELEQEIDRWYERSGWKADYRVEGTAAGYRTVFVGSKSGALPAGLSRPPDGLDTLEEWRLALPLLEAVAISSPLDHEGRPYDPRFESHLQTLRAHLPRPAEEEKTSFWRRLFGS